MQRYGNATSQNDRFTLFTFSTNIFKIISNLTNFAKKTESYVISLLYKSINIEVPTLIVGSISLSHLCGSGFMLYLTWKILFAFMSFHPTFKAIYTHVGV